ncbi:MAG: hypothetical protein E6053_09000 [Finegoldia magna]|uniref:hypothetical protein n=1 Tax=Finegoldia magna TaxID=1260 RepID=UPI002908037B|nr:hypothetical protein [Finegoldia magna]MDU5527588.1 hypothetical protein [Finegoldia magna]
MIKHIKKVYEIADSNIIESIKYFINFIPEYPNVEYTVEYDVFYKDNKNIKRKINIQIKKEINFDGKEFFNKYNTTVKTYIGNNKIGNHQVTYIAYDDESSGKHKDIQKDRFYNIDYIYYKINEFVEYQQEK